MDAIPWEQVGIGSGWALVGMFVTLFYRGRVVPRSSLDDALHDRDQWRAESRIKDQQIAEKDTQLRTLTEVGSIVKAIMSAVSKASERGPT